MRIHAHKNSGMNSRPVANGPTLDSPVGHQARVRQILRAPDLRQQLRFRGRYRYEGSGPFEPSLFEPDLREHVREWLVEHLSVFTVEEPFDEITGRLLAAFRQAHAELGDRGALQRGQSVTYEARVTVDGSSIRISDVAINGVSWTPAPEVPVSVPLDPELEGWWQALMSSFNSFWGDGVEEFQVLFARGPGRALQFRSWQRHEVTEGTRRLPSPQRATDTFGGELRAALQGAFGFPVAEQELWRMTVVREGMRWTLVRSGVVATPPPPGPGDEVILDRRRLYGEIFQRWREELREVGVAIAGFALEELILWIVGGAIFRVLGFALGRLPVLRRLLSLRRVREVFEGFTRMGRGEADELAALIRRGERGEVLSAVEMQRLEQLALRLEGELSGRAATSLGREEMQAFLLRIWQENPILQRLSRTRGLSGEAQQRELIAILETFERQTGIDVQFVDTGVVQTARGAGNFASLRSSPGVLQIERQVLSNTRQLQQEIEHELAFYFSSASGRAPALGESGFNALDLLEMMIQAGGRLPPPVAP